MKSKRLLSALVAAAMIAGSMPVTVFAGRLDYEPEETEVTEVTEPEEKETSKPTVKETKPTEKETEPTEKETEPEVKETEPEVKETEESKETEAAEPTEKETEAAKETEEPEKQTPEDGADSEPAVEKAPEVSTAVRTKKNSGFDDASIKFSNGTLSWKAVDGAVSYAIAVCGGGKEVKTSGCSYDIGSYIDQLIKDREIFKDNYYTVYLYAHDGDGDDASRVGFTEFTFKYASKAEPETKLPEVTNLKITNGVLTWDEYKNDGNEFAGYYIRIIGEESLLGYVESDKTSFNLKNYIAEQVGYGAKESTSYKIQVVALEYVTWNQMAESGFITYNYKKANTMTVKLKKKTVKVSAGKAKKKNQYIKRSKLLTIKKNVGKLSFAKVSGNANITINKTSGKITVKKKTKKGTYKVQIAVKAAGNASYVTSTKTVTVKIKVK